MELAVHQEKIINTFDRLASREKARASDAGEDREEIGSLLDLTGLNKVAVSFTRRLHKMEPKKRDDVLRSLGPLLDLMQKRWDGQTTPDMFGQTAPEPVEPADPPETAGDDEIPGWDASDSLIAGRA